MIKRLFGVIYHPNYLSRLLSKLGWSLQQPLPRAIEQDGEEVQTWRGKEWSRKKTRRNGVDIVFFDEFGISFLDRPGRTWPRGQHPVLRHVSSDRRALSTAVARPSLARFTHVISMVR